MNIMFLQRRRENPLLICCLAAFALVLCGRSKRLTAASASADETSKKKPKNGGLHLADFFASLVGDGAKKTAGADSKHLNKLLADEKATSKLSESQLSALADRHRRGQEGSPPQADPPPGEDRRDARSHRRKVLYGSSVRAHYEALLRERGGANASSPDDAADDDAAAACDYYNDGMELRFDAREMADEESIFARCSHWTYRLCPGRSVAQLHLEPAALTEDDGEPSLKLPPESLLSDTIHFLVPTTHNLGTYLPPWTPDYESILSAAWGPDESRPDDLVEYYVGGDFCSYKPRGSSQSISTQRQSKVVYDARCCDRRESMMEEFFQNDGRIMIRSTAEPEPCRYILQACNVCPEEEAKGNQTLEDVAEAPSSVDPSDFGHLLQTYLQYPPSGSEADNPVGGAFPPFPPSQIEANKKLLRSMFTHAYDSYFYNAFPSSELKPLTCQSGKFNLVKVPALTLIDTLDTFVIMGNYTEFARSIERLRHLDTMMKREFQAQGKPVGGWGKERGGLFSVNQDVSLFETTIRVLGGLLSAHQMAVAFMGDVVSKSDVWEAGGDILSGYPNADDHVESSKMDGGNSGSVDGAQVDGDGECLWEPSDPDVIDASERQNCMSKNVTSNIRNSTSSSWEYDGFLLKLAHDMGRRLLPAFDTATGIPYGTVNLLKGIPPGETTVASLAGAGTLSLEFELLSRLTGDPSFGKAAKLATRALWIRRSSLNLLGKHIDAQNGKWKEYLSGVGSNSDSFYEYLVKHYLLFPDDSDFWLMFVMVYSGVHDNSKLGEWYVDVDMGHGLNGHVRQVFESLMAFYPGMQVLLGETVPSAKTLNSFFLVREFLGLLPERFNFVHWKVEGNVHPLRPELIESCYYLHLANIGLHGSTQGPCNNGSSSPHTSSWLWAADFALHAVHKLSWTPCGFATVTNIGPTTTGGLDFVGDSRDPPTEQKRLNTQHHDEMPSYFLSETIKYLYLTFDAENSILHRDSRDWVFTTEAHPIHYVPVSNSLMQGDDNLNVQLDQVRSLLKERTQGIVSTDGVIRDTASVAKNLKNDQWSKLTPESVFIESIQNVEQGIVVSKQATAGAHDFLSGPSLGRRLFSSEEIESYGIFSSEISAINQAHDQFESQGKGSGGGLGKRCPNFHHSDLQWTHALHNSLDYNAAHSSSLLNEAFKPKDGVDERMLTALASVCFYGTEYYADGMHVDESKSCPIEETTNLTTKSKLTDTKLQPSTSASIPGATRYNMGKELGMFDVSAFPGGDGFVVKHVDSNELLEVSIFHYNPGTSQGAVILVVLTIPPLPKQSALLSTKKESGAYPSLFSRISSGGSWTRRLSSSNGNGDSQGEDSQPEKEDAYARHVVVADLDTNSFHCKVVITKRSSISGSDQSETFLSEFPCSPAFFGQANMPNLVRETGGVVVKALLSPPPPGDELGCKPRDDRTLFDEGNFLHGNNVVQLVRRGDCNFSRKASNHRHAEGIIVINSNPYELFVMAGEKTQPGSNDSPDDDLPVSVLVSGQDGEAIVKTMNDESQMDVDVDASIVLTRASDDEWTDFPYVKGSPEALQILASRGWGIHAVPQDKKKMDGWQLFITQHDKQTF